MIKHDWELLKEIRKVKSWMMKNNKNIGQIN